MHEEEADLRAVTWQDVIEDVPAAPQLITACYCGSADFQAYDMKRSPDWMLPSNKVVKFVKPEVHLDDTHLPRPSFADPFAMLQSGPVKTTRAVDFDDNIRELEETNITKASIGSILSSVCAEAKFSQAISMKTAWMSQMSTMIEKNPLLLRGVHPIAITSKLGAVIRSGPVTAEEEGERGFARSFSVDTLDSFLSHSWHANAKVKALALYSYFNIVPASIAGAISFCVTLALTAGRILPHWDEGMPGYLQAEMINPLFPERVSDSGWCISVYLCVYIATLLMWQQALWLIGWSGKCKGREWSRRWLHNNIFLDKLCIHQTNSSLKQEGIDAIGAYLIKTRQLIILWDQTYFSRLWCVFEVAVWTSCRKQEDKESRLFFYPSSVLALEPILCIIMIVLFIIVKILLCSGLAHLIVQEGTPRPLLWGAMYLPVFLIGVVLMWMVRQFLRDLSAAVETLKTFKVRDAKCSSDSDRKYVYDTIISLYGNLDAFEEYVRSQLITEVQLGIGGIGPIRVFTYGMFVRVAGLPIFVHFCGTDQAYAESTDPSDWIKFVLKNSIAWLIILTLQGRLSMWCLWIRIHTKSTLHELLLCMWCSLVFSITGFSAHSALIAFLHRNNTVQQIVFASLAALLCMTSPIGEHVAYLLRLSALRAVSGRWSSRFLSSYRVSKSSSKSTCSAIKASSKSTHEPHEEIYAPKSDSLRP